MICFCSHFIAGYLRERGVAYYSEYKFRVSKKQKWRCICLFIGTGLICRFLLTANIRNKRIALDSLGSRLPLKQLFNGSITEERKTRVENWKRTGQNWKKLHKQKEQHWAFCFVIFPCGQITKISIYSNRVSVCKPENVISFWKDLLDAAGRAIGK